MKILQISQVALPWQAQRGEHQIQVAEVLGSLLTGVTFCRCIFLLSQVVESVMPMLLLLPILAILWKT